MQPQTDAMSPSYREITDDMVVQEICDRHDNLQIFLRKHDEAKTRVESKEEGSVMAQFRGR